MNQKKKPVESVEKIKEVVASIGILLLMGIITAFLTFYLNRPTAEIMRNTIALIMGGMVVLFLWYQSVFGHTLQYDNEKHQIRFFGIFFVCYLLAGIMIFLPVGSWAFLSVMVLLSMFSNSFIGLASGSTLLMITVSLSPDTTMYNFFFYFMIGLVGISLFRNLDVDFRVGEPLFLSALSSLCLQTAYLVIFENQPLHIEILILPILNLFINLMLLFLILKYFSHLAMYHIQDKYEEINDPEFPLLAKLKEKDKEQYFEAVHRAYLGDRISKRLHINDKAVKGCSYYYKLAQSTRSQQEDEGFLPLQESYGFPEELKVLMEECIQGVYGSKESCVVLTSDQVISRIRKAQKEKPNEEIPYREMITEIFDELIMGDSLILCDISIKELRIMEKVYIEEKLYYDFLR